MFWLFIIIYLLGNIIPQTAIAKPKISVAAIDFANYTSKKSLDFLSFSLAESVSNTLSKDREVQPLERIQLFKILKEMELQQSGLFENAKIIEHGRQIKADFLIMGSFSGTSGKLSVFIKAVEVKSGKIKASSRVVAKLEDIFPLIDQATKKIIVFIKGKSIGSLYISSIPSGASVYLDDFKIGTTPVVGYKITSGEHEIKILKENYRTHATTINLKKNEQRQIKTELVKEIKSNRVKIDLAVFQASFNNIFTEKNDFLFFLRAGYSVRMFYTGVELGMNKGNLNYEYEYQVPFDKRSEKRNYKALFSHFMLTFNPFYKAIYLSPYLGLSGGLLYFNEHGLKESYYDKKESNHLLFEWGPIAGILLFPSSKLGFFIEARYFYTIKKFKRTTTESIVFGKVNKVEETLRINAFLVGAGITLHF